MPDSTPFELHCQYRPEVSISKCSPYHQLNGLVVIKQLLDKLNLKHQAEVVLVCCLNKFMLSADTSHLYLKN